MVGHEALRNFLTHIKSSFASVTLTEDSVHPNGNSAAIESTARPSPTTAAP